MKEKTIKKYRSRKAIAMIELIFAIVIMGFTLLSVPNLMKVATDSSFTSLQQESIASAASHISMILTKHWDENNVAEATILRVTNGADSLTERDGRQERSRINSASVELNATAIGQEGGIFNDMDDAHDSRMSLRNYADTTVTAGDIIDQKITILTTVAYMDDDNGGTVVYDTSSAIQYDFDPAATQAGSSHIKMISTELTTTQEADEFKDKKIILRAFSCNIGGQVLKGRSFL